MAGRADAGTGAAVKLMQHISELDALLLGRLAARQDELHKDVTNSYALRSHVK
jgi:hypothetical protein